MKFVKDLPESIEWYEGMLLAPQHFQQLARRSEDLPAFLTLAAQPFAWGVRSMAIDAAMLPAGILRINQLEAVMPDGLVVWHSSEEPDSAPLEIALAPFADQLQQGELMVHLAVVAADGTGDAGGAGDRYRSLPGINVQDETSEAEAVVISRRRPNLQLIPGSTPSARFVSFPLATVARENELFRRGPFVPPLLAVGENSPLRAMCAALVVRLREKAVFLAKQTSIPSSKLEDRLEFLELKDKLRSIVVLLPYFESVLSTEPVHPYPLYLALSALLGPLSLLRPGAVPPPPVPYRHGDLYSTFVSVEKNLEDMLSAVSQTYREIKFRFDAGNFSLPMDPGWLGGRLVVGLRGQSERDLSAWMDGSLIGSESVLDGLREKRILGAARTRIERADELGIAAGAGITLYTIQPDPEFVHAGRALVIVNPAETATPLRPSEIILYAGE